MLEAKNKKAREARFLDHNALILLCMRGKVEEMVQFQ